MTSIEEMGNPFLAESAYLLALDPEEILEDTVVRTIRNIETIGEKLHSEYVEQKQVKSTTAISHPLSKQHIPLFSKKGTKVRSRSQLEVADLKGNRDLMSRVYIISCQSRAINLDDLCMHENHPYRQSLSDNGNFRANNKCDLVACFGDFTTPVSDPPSVDTIILDGAAVVHLLDPRTAHTFSDYTDTVYIYIYIIVCLSFKFQCLGLPAKTYLLHLGSEDQQSHQGPCVSCSPRPHAALTVMCPQAHVTDSWTPQSFNVSPTRAVPQRRRFSFTHCLRWRSAPGGSTGLGWGQAVRKRGGPLSTR